MKEMQPWVMLYEAMEVSTHRQRERARMWEHERLGIVAKLNVKVALQGDKTNHLLAIQLYHQQYIDQIQKDNQHLFI